MMDSASALARDFVDQVIAINKKYGMAGDPTPEVYDSVIADVAAAFRSIAPARITERLQEP